MTIMRSRRFLPLFITQFLGAFNDNLFKNALVILITYKIAAEDGHLSAQLVNIAFGLFTLPTILFSYLSGQLSDKINRAHMARYVKIAEIALAVAGGLAFYLNNLPFLLCIVFGFGAHSAFFGPVKYAILPQHLREDELVAGNGYVDAGTFVAILTGTILGGLLVLKEDGAMLMLLVMTLVAVAGYWASRNIPSAPAPLPRMRLAFNPLSETWKMICYSSHRRDEFLCIIGISWFWVVGATFLAQFYPLAKSTLHADEHVVTLFLVAFTVGIASGSLLCTTLIKGRVHAGPVPLGALGISFFGIDLAHTCAHVTLPLTGGLLDVHGFLSKAFGWHITLDMVAIAVSGGIFIVPLYTLLQLRADEEHGARAIASNNLMNSAFMAAAAAAGVWLVRNGFTIPQIFLLVSVANLLVALYICRLLPFSVPAMLLKLLFRVKVKGMEHWDAAGSRALIVANHTSFLDAMILAAFLPERPAFAINTFIARAWWIRPFLKLVETFPLDPTNPLAAKALIDRLKQDKKCVIFPEGRITMTGSLMKVYEGPAMIADKSTATVLPVRIEGAQYSHSSRLQGKVRLRFFPRITITLLPPQRLMVDPEIKGRRRRQVAGLKLYDLMSGMIFDSSPKDETLLASLMHARKLHGGDHAVLEDPKREPLSYDGFITRSFVLAKLLKPFLSQEKHIGIMLPNMSVAAITFFAVQVSAKVAAMLNFTSGAASLRSACKAAQVRIVITSRQFIEMAKLEHVAQELEEGGLRLLYLEDVQKTLGLKARMYGFFVRMLPDLAYGVLRKPPFNAPAVILFTSGSEGTPKAVVLSHGNIQSNRYQLASRIDFGPQDIVFNCLPMFHAFGLTGGTLLPMLCGIKVFFYPSPLHYRIVPELVYDTNATILFGTDTFLGGYARFANAYDFYALRYVFAGAEKLKEETRRIWFDKFGIRIFEGYGATETSPVLSVNTAMHYRQGTVGRLLPGIEARFEAVTGIEEGQQLFVKGPNVMLGYMKESAPGVLQPPEQGWYDTGDIVARDGEGYLTIMGRTKRFAKIGGEMVSLAVVESAAAEAWPGCQHAAVSVPDEKKGEQVVLLTDCATAQREDLIRHFRTARISELALPKRIITVKHVPLLGTGKMDYQKARQVALEEG